MNRFVVEVLAGTDAECHHFHVEAKDKFDAEEQVAQKHPELGYWVDWQVHSSY